MAITSGSYIIGNELKFWPKDKALASGVVAIDNKPVDPTDDAVAVPLPCVDIAELTQTSEEKKNYCPINGPRLLTAVKDTNYEAQWKFTLKEVSGPLMRAVFGAEDLEATSPYTPFTTRRREGWFRLIQKDDETNDFQELNFYGSMKVDGSVPFGSDFVTVTLMVDVFLQAANTVTEA